MRIGLVIADFEMKYSSTFQHAARVKYEVDFATSNIGDVKANLQKLKTNVASGAYNHVTIRGYDPTIEEVNNRIDLLEKILKKYREVFDVTTIPSNTKLYTLLEQLKQATAPNVQELAKEVLKEVIAPPEPKKLSKKAQLDVDANARSQQRAMKNLQKASAKKNPKP